ncbi:MAG: hypothetical protein ACE5EO_05985 [Candidatus Krumholzibacteriia bacterium]
MVSSEKLIQGLEAQKARESQLTFGFARRPVSRPYRVDVEEDGVQLRVEVEDFDRLGVMLSTVEVRGADRVIESDARPSLENQVDRVTSDIRCLSGEFQLIEKDTASLVAVLRTPPPCGDRAQYFELVLRGGYRLSLRHFTVGENLGARRPCASNMSMQSFRTLVSHLVRLLSGIET